MENVTITELNSQGDVDFDQDIDTDTVMASGGGIAVNGDVEDSAFNTGFNSGIMAGDDVDLDDSIVGDGNTQLNDSDIGAFAARGNATNAVGENVLLGSGDLVDIDAEGDAQAVTGNGNDVKGDIDVDLEHVDGPVNMAFGDGNSQNALEDNSTNYEDSFNEDYSVEDSYNTRYEDSYNSHYEDNDTDDHQRRGLLQQPLRGQRHGELGLVVGVELRVVLRGQRHLPGRARPRGERGRRLGRGQRRRARRLTL